MSNIVTYCESQVFLRRLEFRNKWQHLAVKDLQLEVTHSLFNKVEKSRQNNAEIHQIPADFCSLEAAKS